MAKLKEKIKKLPLSPGVYIMKSKKGEILYVGKASSLRKRVTSYFGPGRSRKTEVLVDKIADIDFIECESEAQALILEASLIKEKMPKYNIALRDDKSYPYIEITKEKFPRLKVSRPKGKTKSMLFGPYPKAGLLKPALKMIRRIFPYCSCKRFPKNACLFYHLNLCPGPCIGAISEAQYLENIKAISKILRGERKELIEDLSIIQEKPMIKAVEQLENFLEVKFKGFVATELGPYNSIVPLIVASQMENRIAINGDCCGRSKPKISISTTAVKKIPITPYSVVSQYGDKLIIKAAQNDSRGEVIARTLSRITDGSISVARCPMTIRRAKEAIIPQTFSKAIELGREVREANEKNQDPIKALEGVLTQAKLIFKGKIIDFIRVEEGGFTSGEIVIESLKEQKNKLRILYQNEYLLSWLDNQQFISCPDSIIIVDSSTGLGLTPWEEDFQKERMVNIYALEAPDIWKTKEGLQVFGPHLFEKEWKEYKPLSSFIDFSA